MLYLRSALAFTVYKMKFIRINEKDNVAVALAAATAGEMFLDCTLASDLPLGHKMALTPIAEGEDIIKYGFPIGHATRNIAAGEWVHTHNMATNLSGEVEYTYEPSLAEEETVEPTSFMGFRRNDGKVGIRNEVWIIPTVGCVNDIAKLLAREGEKMLCGTVDGVYAFTHPFGCSQTGGDHAQTRKLLASLVKHPNAASVLVLSLGCENLTGEQFKRELGEYDPERVRFLVCQEVEDEIESGKKIISECIEYAAKFTREPIPASELIVGMKCGGSDGLSGITANPTVGRFSDMLVAEGGTTVLTEVPEMFGAEGMLMNRCESREVFDDAVNMINSFKEYFLSHGEVVYENPSPGNKNGGITTLEDKSCGCVQKGGSATIRGIVAYGDRVKVKGLNMLSGPGNDLVSSTALTAAGAHLILFTTGRGTPFGAPAPTMKIATNTPLATKKSGWIDFNAGTVADGVETLDEAGRHLFEEVIAVASGKRTRTEEMGYREISIFKDGVIL